MVTHDDIKTLAALSIACEQAHMGFDYSVCAVDYTGVHITSEAFKTLYGQGDVIARGTDEYPYEHTTIVDGVRVFCIGGEVI